MDRVDVSLVLLLGQLHFASHGHVFCCSQTFTGKQAFLCSSPEHCKPLEPTKVYHELIYLSLCLLANTQVVILIYHEETQPASAYSSCEILCPGCAGALERVLR